MAEDIFERLEEALTSMKDLMQSIATKVEQIEGKGGGGSASIEDYESGKNYKRNMLLVDTETDTVYRARRDFTSTTVAGDCANGDLKLLGYEGQIVSFSDNPKTSEIEALPDQAVVVVYNELDDPYDPDNPDG